MAIITISRELAALGDETSGELAKLLGYHFVDKKALEERISSCGAEGAKLDKYDERKPGLFASLSRDRDDYLHYLKTAVLEEAEQGSRVFIGRGTGMILKGAGGVISVFLVSPLEIRVERVKSYFHCNEKRARQIIERSDQDRIGFHRYFFDMDWKDPENYHLCLNTGAVSPSRCAAIIKSLKDSTLTAEAEAAGAARIKEMILEQRVKHHVGYERGIPVHFLEAQASGGVVSLYGVAGSQVIVDAAVKAATEAAGAATVRSEIQVVREYTMIP